MVLVATLTGSIASSTPAQQTMDELSERDRLVWAGLIGEILRSRGDEDQPGLSLQWRQIIGHTLLQAMDLPQLRTLKAYRHVGETLRTDKQVGSSATSMGTTSLLTKPGLASLLAFAIERGAIEQETSGTNINLRTSPAALFKVLYRGQEGQQAEDDPAYSWLSRIGASATLPFDDTASTDQGNINLDEVTDWSVQANLNFWGDRTTHSERFREMWDKDIAPLIVGRLKAASKLAEPAGDDEKIKEASDRALRASTTEVRRIIAKNEAAVRSIDLEKPQGEAIAMLRRDAAAQEMFAAVAGELEHEIIAPIRSGTLVIPETTRLQLETALKDLINSHDAIAKIKDDLLAKEFQRILTVPVFTLEYSNHKALTGSNFSELKLLLQHRVEVPLVLFPEPFDLIWNANASFFHHPDKMLDEETVRDYGIGLGAEFSFDNPFAGLVSEGDLSSITLLFAGRFARLESQKDEAGFAQAKLEIPLAAGLSIPLSVTYSSRTEDSDETKVRGNFGFSFDIDKLYAVAGLALGR